MNKCTPRLNIPTIALIPILMFPAYFVTPASAQVRAELVILAPSALPAPQLRVYESFASEPGVSQVKIVSIFTPPAVDAPAFIIELSPRDEIVLAHERTVVRTSTDYTWIGESPDTGVRGVFVIREHRVIGTAMGFDLSITIRPLAADQHILAEWDLAYLQPPDCGPVHTAMSTTSAMVASSCSPQGPAIPAECQKVTLVAGYTEAALADAGGDPIVMEGIIQAAVDKTNDIHLKSNVGLKLSDPVSFLVKGFTECCLGDIACGETEHENDCNDLQAGNDSLFEIHDQRELNAADIVVLFKSNNCGSRVFAIPHGDPFAAENEALAFALIQQNQADGIQLAHEIGHMHGAIHNIERTSITDPLLPYSHGYCQQKTASYFEDWHTVMSYNTDADNNVICANYISYWSNPDVVIMPGTEYEAPTGNSEFANVACLLRQTACTVAGFREPGQLTIASFNILVRHGLSKQVAVTVTRNGLPVSDTPVEFSFFETNVASANPVRSRTGTDGVVTTRIHGLERGQTGVTIRAVGVKLTAVVDVTPSLTATIVAWLIGVVVVLLLAYRVLGPVISSS